MQRIKKQIADSSTKRMIVNSHHDVLVHNGEIADCRKYGFSLSESVIFNLRHNDRKKYITTWEAYQPRYNNKMQQYFPISDDKYLFHLVFSHYVRTSECYALINGGGIMWLKQLLKPI